MSIELKDVTQDIVEQVVALRVKENQQELIHDARYFIARASLEQELRPLAAFHEGILIGFCVYSVDDEDGKVWIQSMMIDEKHQGKGLSAGLLRELIALIRKERNPAVLYVSFDAADRILNRLFSGAGFVPTGEQDEDEDVWILRF